MKKKMILDSPSSAFTGPSKGTSSSFGVWNWESLRCDRKPDFYMQENRETLKEANPMKKTNPSKRWK